MASSNSSQLVLVVDDDPFQRHQVRQFLGHLGIASEEARNGAIAIAMTQRLRPAVIIMDVLMPGLDGVQIVEKLQDTHDAKIILMIGDTERANIASLSVYATIEKPIRLTHLGRFVLQALGVTDDATPHRARLQT